MTHQLLSLRSRPSWLPMFCPSNFHVQRYHSLTISKNVANSSYVCQGMYFPRAVSSFYSSNICQYSPSFRIHNNVSVPGGVSFQQTRSFGILDSLNERKARKLKESQQEKFKQWIDDMMKTPTYNMGVHLHQTKLQAETSGVTGWKSYIPGKSMMTGSSKADEAKLLKSIEIMEKMTEKELVNPDSIGRDEKIRLAQQAVCQVPDVNDLLKQFSQMKMIHGWLHELRRKNKPLPSTQGEVFSMMNEHRPQVSRQMRQNMKPRRR